MNLLLDTHIFLWSLLEPEKLADPVVRALGEAGSDIWLSSISVWEIAILAEKGRILLNAPVATWMDAALKRCPVREAPVDHRVALESRSVNLPHQDPADRFIAATAVARNLVLVTADEKLLKDPGWQVLPNR
jgi:PIN domain nuclease of toxin-antitoxin system